jgi:exocyst complex component 4
MRRPSTDDRGAYTNGDGYQYPRRYDLDTTTRDNSADERSRSRGPAAGGGYGGLGRAQDDFIPRVGSPARLERSKRASGEGRAVSRSRSRAASQMRAQENSKQVEDILRYIDRHWGQMANESCVPVKVALQLMDQSSLGLAGQYDSFQDTHQQLQSALKAIVNQHHQGFNSSIGTFHQIQASIQSSQQRVRTLKQSLVQAKGNLRTTRPELKAFAQSSQSYDQMLQTLAYIEQLQLMPEKLEAQISEKRFLGAVETLQDALKIMHKPDMEDIGALSDLRVYFSNQEHSITDILIQELHSHLYLKSPYCEERWKQYTNRSTTTGTASFEIEGRQLYRFLESFDPSQILTEDTSRNPEADTFSYIQLLVEALDRMSRLDLAIDQIEQRLPVELFRVVERSYTEVEQNYPGIIRGAAKQQHFQLDNINADINQDKKMILEDMLSTLYAKFEAIAEGHRVLHEVIGGILSRQGSDEPALLRSFRELWKLYQSEIRSLLHDHLAASGSPENSSHPEHHHTTNMFKPHARDRNKRLFKLADTDSKSTELTIEKEDLDFILKSSVPGLAATGTTSAAKDAENEKNEDRSATGHKLLVEPSVFNMGILLPPSLSFLTRLKDIVPPSSEIVLSTLTSFLDDFLINVFLPQLEEALTDMCMAASVESDAFQQDPKWQVRAQKPVFKGTANFLDLIKAFCMLLDSLPHDQAFSQLVMAQMRVYYDKCYNWYRALVMRPQQDSTEERKPKRSAALAEYNADMRDAVATLLAHEAEDADDVQRLMQEQTASLIANVKASPLTDADLILDRKCLSGLCTLYNSTRWFVAHATQLRHMSSSMSNSNTAPTASSRHQTRRWTTLISPNPHAAIYLPLDTQSSRDFDAITTSMTELGSLILRTLHLELRLQILHGVAKAMNTTYLLGQPYNDPDPAILSLSTQLLSLDETLSLHLPPAQHSLLVLHISHPSSVALTTFTPSIPAMDLHGIGRMHLNIFVLQNVLKDIEKEASLQQAADFWSWFGDSAWSIVGGYEEGALEKSEARELIRLWGSGKGDVGRVEVEEALKRL